MEINRAVIRKDVLLLQEKTDYKLFENKTVVITGCNGLIGAYLLDYFYEVSKKIDVKIICTSFSPSLSESRFSSDLIGAVTYFSWDASTPVEKSFIEDADYVYYCSGYAQPAKFIKDPIRTSLINTLGVYSILTALKDKATFCYMSSSETYGDPDKYNIPTKETYNGNYSVTSNRACYIASKRLGEALCLSETGRLNIKICRVSLTYGPGTAYNDERVIQQFIRKAREQKNITLLDDGSAVRTFCYIRDSVEMILNISLKGQQTIYNVAIDKGSITILELAQLIGGFLQADVSAKTSNEDAISKNSPVVVLMDIDRYLGEFGAREFVDIHTGMRNIIDYFGLLS